MILKPVILISSCKKDRERGYHDAIRETWANGSPIPHFFCLGDLLPNAPDEIGLDCADNYWSLPWKTHASLKWAWEQGYTHYFRAFTDTYIHPQRLLESEFNGAVLTGPKGDNIPHIWDYVGNPCGVMRDWFMHGGPGYWLSSRAVQYVVVQKDAIDQKLEDVWVGELMRKFGVVGHPDFRYSMGRSYARRENPVMPTNDIITEHLGDTSITKYHPDQMRERHLLAHPELR